MNILHIDSSPAGDHSYSRKLSASLVDKLKSDNPGATVVYRDLVANPLPHLDPFMLGALFAPAEGRSEAQTKALANSDQAVKELMESDTIVIGSPMHNFGISSQLKSWIDHVVRAGLTFHYTAEGPKGLVPPGKKVYIVVARGGVYSEGPYKAYEHQDSYLKAILGFIGLTDVTVIPVEGVSMGPEAAAKAVAQAEAAVAKAA
jgi:FMN-dependent NADH-azoreductase